MQRYQFLLCLSCLPVLRCAPPRRMEAEEQQSAYEAQPNPQAQMYQFAYSKYLEKVVSILDNSTKFKNRLSQMSETDIKTGKIADHFDEVEPHISELLTKSKIDEMNRISAEIASQLEKDKFAQNIKAPEHIDYNDAVKFGQEDLRKLILKTVADMEKADEQRRDNFKQAEMEQQAELDHKMAKMSEEERLEFAKKLEQERQRSHAKHEKVNHAGSRVQLEEVWENDDMDKQAFDARTFFALHDLNGNGYWNEEEVSALFQLELEKVYNYTDPADWAKRTEEMHRMREHVVQQMDTNHDRLISLEEFLNDPEAQQPQAEEGRKDFNDERSYNDEELKRFKEEYAKRQGWGEYAYQSDPPSTEVPAQQESANINYPSVQRQPVHPEGPQFSNQALEHPPSPASYQPYIDQNIKSVQSNQQQYERPVSEQRGPPAHQTPLNNKIDPAYGV